MLHHIIHYFDKLEDRIRGRLSRYPIIYTLVGGIAIVVFWRGVWITTDQVVQLFPEDILWLDGILTTAASVFILLASGLFVSFFINDQIILSGLKKEKKLAEKTEAEIRGDRAILVDIERKIDTLESNIERIKKDTSPS